MAKNKVVIKINYDNEQGNKPETSTKLVTEWHFGRIVVASVLVLVAVSGLIYLFMSGDDSVDKTNQTAVIQQETKPTKIEDDIQQSAITNKIDRIDETETKVSDETVIQSVEQTGAEFDQLEKENTSEKSIFDPRISRAVLTHALVNKEPVGEISSPITADKNKAISVYFFTEIKKMKGEVLFHHWYRNDKLVFKRKINILGNRWRASTSKLISYSKKGHWVVKLTDEEGNILSVMAFNVI